MFYAELEELCSKLTEVERRRAVLRFVLNIRSKDIEEIERCSKARLCQNFSEIDRKFKEYSDHEAWVETIQKLFAD